MHLVCALLDGRPEICRRRLRVGLSRRERLDVSESRGVPESCARSVFDMFQGVGVDDQVWDDPLPPSVIVAVVVAQPVDLLRESVFAGLGVAPRAAFVGDTRAFEPPREQVYDRVVGLPDAVVLCAPFIRRATSSCTTMILWGFRK